MYCEIRHIIQLATVELEIPDRYIHCRFAATLMCATDAKMLSL